MIESQALSDPGTEHALLLPTHELYRRLRIAGLTAREAGSVVAHAAGLRPVPSGWTGPEVERLLFVRAMVDAGRLGS